MNWFFVRLWNKSAVHRSAVDPKPVKFVCEIAFFPSGDQNNAKCANKQKKNKKQKQKRKISSLHDRIFAAGHRISFFPPGLNLTDKLSFATVCKTMGSADQMFFKCDEMS